MRGEDVARVEGAGPHVQLDVDPDIPQSRRVVGGLVAEDLGRADVEERRRQPREVGGAGRCGVRRDVVGADAVAEQGAPAGLVADPVPHADAVERARRRGAAAVVEHGVVEQLPDECRAAAVARGEGDARRESGAGARAREQEPVGAHAELRRVRGDPLERGVAVLERDGVGMLRRKPVFDGDQADAEVGHPGERRVEAAEPVAEHHAARVEHEHGRQRLRIGGACRRDDGCPDARAPVSRKLEVDGVQTLVGEHLLARRRGIRLAHEGDELGRDRRRKHAPDDSERRLELGVDPHGGHGAIVRGAARARPGMVGVGAVGWVRWWVGAGWECWRK